MRDLVSRFRSLFVYAGLFSLAINLLLLVPPLYMLQVFDRVLASRSGGTSDDSGSRVDEIRLVSVHYRDRWT